jgi:ribosomal protein S3AE
MGREYVIEYCISALKSNNETKSYRIYVSDALMAIAENTTHFVGMEGMVDYGKSITKRWVDALNPEPEEKEKPEDNRPSAEIASDIWDRIRGHKT